MTNREKIRAFLAKTQPESLEVKELFRVVLGRTDFSEVVYQKIRDDLRATGWTCHNKGKATYWTRGEIETPVDNPSESDDFRASLLARIAVMEQKLAAMKKRVQTL